MNKIITVSIIAILVISGIVIIGFSQLLNENNQTPTTTPTPTPTLTPTPTATPNDPDSIPKPSNPVFNMKLVAHPYDVPPTNNTTIDPFTGEETINIIPGYHVENKSIEITIRNQPFTTYVHHRQEDNKRVNLFYRIEYKGHYADDWRHHSHGSYIGGSFLQSDSENTVVSFLQFPTEGEIDIRVQAQIGYFISYNMPWTVYELVGEVSGWNTQTLTIPQV